MRKAILFDLDGTLIDSTDAIINSFTHTFEQGGFVTPDFDTIYKTISMHLEAQFSTLCDGDPDHMTQVFREHYFATCTQGTKLLPGVGEALEKIKATGLNIAIATSKSHQGSTIILEHFGLMDYFDFIIGGDTVQHHKPHPECLERSLAQWGIEDEEMLFIGDTEFDTEAAHRAGIDCIAVATGYASRLDLEQSTAEAVFDSMSEAIAHVLQTCIK
jgi:phosphoglycolate phosphatase